MSDARARGRGEEGATRRAPRDLFHPVRTRRTFEDVVQQIVDLVKSGKLREGDYLPGERTLASAMEVSRPTVRLAIEMLAKAGVVTVHPGRGGGIQLVSMWVPDHFAEADEEELRPADIFAGLEARRALEPRVVQLAALRATEPDYEALREAIELQKAAGDDTRKALQVDMLFHRRMWAAAGNAMLERLMGTILGQLAVPLDMAMRTSADKAAAIEIHEHTLAALMRGDMGGIDTAMDEHMAYLEAICEDVFGRRRVRELPDFLRRQAADGDPSGDGAARATTT